MANKFRQFEQCCDNRQTVVGISLEGDYVALCRNCQHTGVGGTEDEAVEQFNQNLLDINDIL